MADVNFHYIIRPWGEVRVEEVKDIGLVVHPAFDVISRSAVKEMYALLDQKAYELGYDWVCFHTSNTRLVNLIFRTVNKEVIQIGEYLGTPIWYHERGM